MVVSKNQLQACVTRAETFFFFLLIDSGIRLAERAGPLLHTCCVFRVGSEHRRGQRALPTPHVLPWHEIPPRSQV